jgi:Fe-S-cluster containining protein
MTKRKFRGKIHQDPETALARGPREVMASLWEEYLAAILETAQESRRFEVLRREAEQAAGFAAIYSAWNGLPLEERGQAWRRLLAAAREKREATSGACLRCGECCEMGSPTLLAPDLPLFQQEVLTWNEVYTLRAGENVTDRQGEKTTLNGERLKIREVPGSRQCWFYLAATGSCRIYESRPEQCRRQNCWGEPAPEPESGEFLNRSHLLAQVPEVWDLVRAHEDRCSLTRVRGALPALEGAGGASEALFEALHFDHHLRGMLREEWGVSTEALEFLLGRPLTVFLKALGVNATLTPEGVYRLEAVVVKQ